MYLEKYNIRVPDSILILEDSNEYTIEKNSHFVFRKSFLGSFSIDYINGKYNRTSFASYSEDDLYKMFFNGKLKYKEYSLYSFNNLLKAFL